MSTGVRYPIEKATVWAERLMDRWRVAPVTEDKAPESPVDVLIVGSVRRRWRTMATTVGDIEFLAVVPPGWTRDKRCGVHDDPLFQRINATLVNSWESTRKEALALFGADPAAASPTPTPTSSSDAKPFARAGRGFAPGFMECTIDVFLNKEGTLTVPVQVFRCERGAWGWQAVMRTGPDDLGKSLLKEWKRRQGVLGTDRPGSKDGFLVDGRGERRPCHSEREFFEMVGLAYYEPHERERLLLTMRPH